MSATITSLPHRGEQSDAPMERSAASIEGLEDEISSLASRIAQHTCRFLELLAAFDEAGGWHDRGFVSASQWLSWRCGMTETTAREHMRVARALPHLPLITAEFRTGRLSYSKVRALTRVATADTEPELVSVARGASAGQLERFISGLRSAGVLDDVEEAHERRRVTWRVSDDGDVHLTAQLSAADGAIVIDALLATQEYLRSTDPDRRREDPGEPAERYAGRRDESDEEDTRRSLADALVQICAEGPLTETAEPAHKSRRAETVVHATIDQLASMGSATAEEGSARLELGPALHPETARRLTCDTGLVLHLKEGDASYNVVPSTHPGRTIDVGRRTRTPNAALMRALWDRDQGCRYPACGRRRFVHAHHAVHWAHGGPTELDNLVLLCGQHHRLLHEGGFSLSMQGKQVRFFDCAGDKVAVVGERTGAPAATADGEADTDTRDAAYALSPVNGGPMDLEWAVSVVADHWEHRRARTAASHPDAAA
ncbi:MAG TPA: DUF222 domain-containing protein [Beutenbergiaceae bacterium]|nr:DUF222 domain-containing protein [Beutenbergiaceae bacterium]